METKLLISDSEPIIETPSGINVELLNRVAEYIASDYEHFDMDEWELKPHHRPWYQRYITKRDCGTTRCIAGWTCFLSGNISPNTPNEAQQLLGLTYEQANRLFYRRNWPEPYRSHIEDCTSKTDNAWTAAQRIRHFIKTNGAE